MQGGFRHFIRLASVVALGLAPVALGACAMDTPSQAIGLSGRASATMNNETARIPTADMTEAMLSSVAAHYRSSGDGPVHITVTYDPKSKKNTAMKAAGEAARISTYLRRKAEAEVLSDIASVTGSGTNSETQITYDVRTAQAPAECKTMGGIAGEPTRADDDYIYGCGIETLFAKQIANPKDLNGRDGLRAAETDGGRFSNIVGSYRTGEPNSALVGESASQ